MLDKVTADAFVDAYGSLNFNFPKPTYPPASVGVAIPGLAGGNQYRAFDVEANGFALNWVGVNATYAADPIGGTVGLRMGPGASLYNTGSEAAFGIGLQFVKQAYATWKPLDKLTLDFGKWDEPFGSEVADSQLNMNYTRSGLFWYYQPLFFTGLRVDYAASSMVDVKVFAANGWNVTWDNNSGKTFGAQIVLTPASQAVFYLGYAGGPEQTDFATTTMMPGVGGGPPITGTVVGENGGRRSLEAPHRRRRGHQPDELSALPRELRLPDRVERRRRPEHVGLRHEPRREVRIQRCVLRLASR